MLIKFKQQLQWNKEQKQPERNQQQPYIEDILIQLKKVNDQTKTNITRRVR